MFFKSSDGFYGCNSCGTRKEKFLRDLRSRPIIILEANKVPFSYSFSSIGKKEFQFILSFYYSATRRLRPQAPNENHWNQPVAFRFSTRPLVSRLVETKWLNGPVARWRPVAFKANCGQLPPPEKQLDENLWWHIPTKTVFALKKRKNKRRWVDSKTMKFY